MQTEHCVHGVDKFHEISQEEAADFDIGTCPECEIRVTILPDGFWACTCCGMQWTKNETYIIVRMPYKIVTI
jgi:ribosomal protein L37AE/L43A